MAESGGDSPLKEELKDGSVDAAVEQLEQLQISGEAGAVAPPFNLIPLCVGAPEEDFTDCETELNPSGTAAAHIARESVWKGRDALKVCFMNPEVLEGWMCEKKKMSVEMVMEWVRVWEQAPSAPKFMVTSIIKKADIRVKFSAEGGCWSMVGRQADFKGKAKEPTMMLNLCGEYPESYIRHLVIHEFGHALGLEHEHQRSDFWDTVKEFIDIDRMENDRRFGYLRTKKAKAAYFGRDWFLKKESKSEYKSDYDSQSIMHYWFAVDWIKKKAYHDLKGIREDSRLTDKQKLYLRGIHDRNNSYAHNPSPADVRILNEAYKK